MSGCLDRIRCNCDCDYLEPAKEWLATKRNMLASTISGTLFALGWWVVIDSCVESSEPIYAVFHICGILSTIALFMINAISTGQVTGDMYTEGCLGQRGARAWLFVGFVLAFAGLIGSLWVFIQGFLVPAIVTDTTTPVPILPTSNTTTTTTANNTTTSMPKSSSDLPACFPCWWQGVSFFIQNLLIFLSTLVFKFGRKEEEAW